MGRGQRSTYSVAPPDPIAAAEREKESRRIAEAERLEFLRVQGKAELDRIAIATALEMEANATLPDPAIAEAQEAERLAQREADEAHLAKLAKQHERAIALFYTRMAKILSGLETDRATIAEARGIAARLGVSNPAAASVMQIGEIGGLNLEKVGFAEAIFGKFVELYRKSGGQVLAGPFEGVRGTSSPPLTTKEIERLAHQERKRNLPAVRV